MSLSTEDIPLMRMVTSALMIVSLPQIVYLLCRRSSVYAEGLPFFLYYHGGYFIFGTLPPQCTHELANIYIDENRSLPKNHVLDPSN